MKCSLCISFFLLVLFQNSYAQKEASNWYFGFKAGVSFSSGSPVALPTGPMTADEGCATISDANGNLLFYTNGIEVWNKQHQIMQNGANLNGAESTTQAAIIVPQPGNDSIYYVFTNNALQDAPGAIWYSVVNMKLNSNLGAVTVKNVRLTTITQYLTEKLTAVLHCNNKDVWVITRMWESTEYFAWLVTSAGVAASPVISTTQNFLTGHGSSKQGYLKVSPDGKKIASVQDEPIRNIEISNFNNQTGKITNTINTPVQLMLPNEVPQPFFGLWAYGIEFSPDSRLLYNSGKNVVAYTNPDRFYNVSFIYQYNISVHDSLQIVQSRKLIDTTPTGNYHMAMQLGIDNKIYVSERFANFLSSINSPNSLGAGAGFQLASVPIPGQCILGLPPFIQSYFGNNIYNYSFNNNCSSQNVSFQINNTQGYSSIKWDFGDPPSGINNTSTIPNPAHNFTAAGIYEVKLIVNRSNNPCAIPDTIQKSIWVGNVSTFLGVDTTICEKDTITLQVNAPNGVNYLWSNNTTGNAIRVTNPGTYAVRVTAGACTYDDEIIVSQQLLPRFSLGNDASICSNVSITLQPTPAIPNGNYLWNTNATTATLTVNTAGQYWLQGKDNLGCSWRDTIQVAAKQLPNFNLGKDTGICQQQTLLLNTQIPNANYLWSTGATSQSIIVSAAGIYWADVTKDGCTYRDSLELSTKPLPVVNLGKDSTLCEGQTLLLNAANTGATYLWQDNSVQQNFTVNRAGEYNVMVNLNGCTKRDTIKVDYNLKPRFTLGADKIICPGETIVLQANPNNVTGISFAWQNGSTLPVFSTNQPGLYVLAATNQCGTTTDSVVLKDGTCKIYVPNAFTPDANRINDIFKVLNTEAVTEFEFIVFNRWGQVVFQTKDKNQGWDGRMNLSEMPAGMYPWTLKYKEMGSNEARFLKGQVMMIR